MRNSNGSPIFSDFKTGFSWFNCFPMAGQRERRLCMGTRFEILRQDVRTINTITIQELLCSIEQDHELKIKKNRERRITKMKLIFILKVSPLSFIHDCNFLSSSHNVCLGVRKGKFKTNIFYSAAIEVES